MSIPQRADKWIVSALSAGLGVVWLLRSTVPGGFSAMDWLVIPVLCGLFLTAVYMIWCAICRLIARALRVGPTSGNVRHFANSSFFVLMLVVIFAPYVTNQKPIREEFDVIQDPVRTVP
jgi:hypothetical protein